MTLTPCPTDPTGTRIEARDFFEHPIQVEDFIVYPTGGTSCRMVLGKVLDVINIKNGGIQRDGLRGKSNKRIVVLRIKEGNKTLGESSPQNSTYGIDTRRKQSISQLHRVVVVPRPHELMDRVVMATGIQG